jgi:phosphoribosylanthranilate isomerase
MLRTSSEIYVAFIDVARKLNALDITPVLYGSLGIWVLTGGVPDGVDDMDILLPEQYLNASWSMVRKAVESLGYTQDTKHPHEFWKEVVRVSFDSLERVALLSHTDLRVLTPRQEDGADFKILSLNQLLQVYQGCLTLRKENGKARKDELRIAYLTDRLCSPSNVV